ncbi:MAG: guanitoxin biosynthesis heme-dependent pre-guanitoxin N-hydroxylase GntA, partial [Ferruginibacter sp.]
FDGNEDAFESFFWQRLQSLSSMDARNHEYDARVSAQPDDPNFSFSLGKEAFFVIGMHAGSSRPSRRFSCPVLIFNPHEQFQQMKTTGQYDKMKAIVRKRDLTFSGSLNPMLDDFGKTSEALQYTGKAYPGEWKCPLKIEHASD